MISLGCGVCLWGGGGGVLRQGLCMITVGSGFEVWFGSVWGEGGVSYALCEMG